MKFAQKIAKREALGGLCYPLNYALHSRVLPLYLIDESQVETSKSHLVPNF